MIPKEIQNTIDRARDEQWSALKIDRENINYLTAFIEQLTQLECLDLSCTGLTSLPESIGNITKLRHLIISKNKLKNLPESFGCLTELIGLSLCKINYRVYQNHSDI
jgi:Leucine-rich repeat (LRR) protein